MHKGIMTAVGTVLAVGLLITAPVGMARQGADDPPGDDNIARGGGGGGGGGNGADVRVAGSCSLSSTAKIKLGPQNGRVEAEFEVDENRVGKTWQVTMNRNGVRVLSRKATTNARSGSFEVRAVISAGSPRTKVTAVAKRVATGEVCRATATL